MNRLPLLLLPGTLTNATVWRHAIDALRDVADIHVADLASDESTAEMAARAIRAMPSGGFAVAGFSLGGYVALEVARQAPDRVQGLALVSTSARPDTPEASAAREKSMALAQRDFGRLTVGLVQFMLAPSALAREDLVREIRQMMDEVGAEAFVRQSRAVMGRADSRALLPQLRCPTLIVCGALDKVVAPELSQEMAAAIPGARLHVLPDTGHMLPMEQAPVLSALLRDWIVPLAGPAPAAPEEQT